MLSLELFCHEVGHGMAAAFASNFATEAFAIEETEAGAHCTTRRAVEAAEAHLAESMGGPLASLMFKNVLNLDSSVPECCDVLSAWAGGRPLNERIGSDVQRMRMVERCLSLEEKQQALTHAVTGAKLAHAFVRLHPTEALRIVRRIPPYGDGYALAFDARDFVTAVRTGKAEAQIVETSSWQYGGPQANVAAAMETEMLVNWLNAQNRKYSDFMGASEIGKRSFR